MSRKAIVIALVLVIALAAGGTAMAISKRDLAFLLRAAFQARGMPPVWGEALARVESGLSMGAINKSGPDGARGGAWGPTQITEKTARAHGYDGPMEDLVRFPSVAAEWSARIAAAGNPKTIEDLGAWWNAGRLSFDLLPPDHITRVQYVPRLRKALTEVFS